MKRILFLCSGNYYADEAMTYIASSEQSVRGNFSIISRKMVSTNRKRINEYETKIEFWHVPDLDEMNAEKGLALIRTKRANAYNGFADASGNEIGARP